MKALSSQELKSILNFIKMTNACRDEDILRDKVLDSLLNILRIENSIFFLADENSKLTNFFGKNIEEKYFREFRDYYHQFDPFKLIQGSFHGNMIVKIKDLVDFPSFLDSEYYNDFLRPQRIHHKICVYLKSDIELLGVVGLFRPKEVGNFSEKEIKIIKTITPYLCQTLKNIRVFRKIQIENSILKMADRDSSSGLIILNDSMGLVHMNNKAKEILKNLSEPDNGHRKLGNGENNYPFIPYLVTEDCYHLKEQMERGSFKIIPLPINRILKLSEHKKYSLCSQILTKEMSSENRFFYLVKIDELTQQVNLDIGRLENGFGLTKREIEILVNTFNGLKNAEIAEKLFISEITVKKHLQHIFEKIGVNSRATLIRKILEYQCTEPRT
jgi:DNA-binding CsgD family transcriptional regulator